MEPQMTEFQVDLTDIKYDEMSLHVQWKPKRHMKEGQKIQTFERGK